MKSKRTLPVAALAAATTAALLAACGGESTKSEDTVTVAGDVPLAYVKRATAISMNPTDGTPFAAGGDLMLREKSSPSATEHNLTARFTQGLGDASDPEVSYDGKRIVFAMRCPATNTATSPWPATRRRWRRAPAAGTSGSTTAAPAPPAWRVAASAG